MNENIFTIAFFIVVGLLIILMIINIINIYYVHQLLKSLNNKSVINSFKINKMHDILFDDVNTLSENTNSLKSLSSSLGMFMNQMQRNMSDKIYPTPQLSEMIHATIKEQIYARYMFTKNLLIPPAGFLEDLSKIVCLTYPHVDAEWITRACAVAIEQFNASQSNGQT